MKQESVVIGKKRYLINSWKTSTQLRNLPKLGKAFAVPIMFLAGGGEDNVDGVFAQALMLLFEQMEEQNTDELFNLILSEVRLEDELVDLDKHFEDLDELLQVATKVLELNYKSLFTGKGFGGFLSGMVPLTHQVQG